MGQILSIIFSWLWGEPDDKKKPSEKLPLVSPPSSRPALQPSLRSFRDYTLQSNVPAHPPVALSSSSSSSTQSKSNGASRFEPQQQTLDHQLKYLSSYGLSIKIASSPAHPRLDTHQLSSTSCRPSSTTQIQPKLVQTHQPLSSNSFGLSHPSGTSPAQPKIQTHSSLLSISGTRSGETGAPHLQPVIVPLTFAPSRNLGTSHAQPKIQTHSSPLSGVTGAPHLQPVIVPLTSAPSRNLGTSHAQPKIQTHSSLLPISGGRSGATGAPNLQPVIVPLTSAPSRNLGINIGASPRNSRSDGDALNPSIPAKLKIQVVGDEKQVSARLQQYNRIEEKELVGGLVGKNWYDYRSREEDEDLEEQKLSIEVRWIKHYRSDYKILLVGEGDFSFSASLAVAFDSATNITATSLDSIEFLSTNYRNALSNINKLRTLGAKVMHDVDATKMANVFPFKCMRFDRVVYNFPLAGFFPNESKEVVIWRHRMLVQKFFENAKSMIEIHGEIHITHKCNGFFKEWNLEFLASRVGLRLIEEVSFNVKDYRGYGTKYGFGGDKNFDCIPSKTYKFGLKKPTEKTSHRFMR